MSFSIDTMRLSGVDSVLSDCARSERRCAHLVGDRHSIGFGIPAERCTEFVVQSRECAVFLIRVTESRPNKQLASTRAFNEVCSEAEQQKDISSEETMTACATL